jgi:RimJ/RimL family protein N-acetyltransferase
MRSYVCLPRQLFEHLDRTLRPVQPGDIEDIRQWRNAQLNVLRQPRQITVAEQKAYYDEHIWPTMNEARPRNLLLGYLQGGQLIGYGGLVHIQWEHRRAEVSFLLNPARVHRQEEYQTDFQIFLRMLKAVAFGGLSFHRLFTETYATRKHHIAVLEEEDFHLEGILRDHVVVDNKPIDSLIHGCLSLNER